MTSYNGQPALPLYNIDDLNKAFLSFFFTFFVAKLRSRVDVL